ncbi:pentatricopeptide repeat-containing protein [Tripterygium wilfordii]|uniref:Pentatricopeptide repeat-containing protein n=1 Tax=Tripterygium wilfordii TaxID=458696 RepID=A0A7J7CU88_TRIWF|nr:pentatricopeptide repeat-containing protein At3g53360, mitochondrial isoform X1 [Tripterygium wilfordii]XP_038720726.1 pentatricopeptide repeat-containing protein At3g53360, mitochondrial isoform X1 [Tripterygium wilfordii]KAF5737558.1 pentatricopeptide repeat-containing protein [Tripterygium wilfordii]
MIRNLRYSPRIALSYNDFAAVKPTGLPSLRTEQFTNEHLTNDYIQSLCKQRLYREALDAFDFIRKNTAFNIELSTYARLICACSALRSLEHGRKVHNHILTSNCQPDIILQNHILNLYGKCGSLKEARKFFDGMVQRNLVSWTSVIAGYSQNGKEVDAILLYLEMLQSGVLPDHFTFGSILKACSGLGNVGLGRQIHAQVIKSEFGSHLIAQNALIAMYSKFDKIADAWDVFFRIREKDLISWSSMIAGFSQLGYECESLHYFRGMVCQGTYVPNEYLFGSAFRSCSSLLKPEYGRQIHSLCLKFGFGGNNFAGCSLCDMYARCGFLGSARIVFRQIERPDLASWNAIIAGIASGSDANEALSQFARMRHLGLIPDDITFRSLLCSCTNPLSLYHGMQVHSYIIKLGFDFYVSVCNALLTMYAKCSNLHNAFSVFEEMRNTADSVSWNAVLTSCLLHKQPGEVLRLSKLMLGSEIKPDHITINNILGACAEIASLEMGNQIHCYTMKSGLILQAPVVNGLIDMYAKCGSLVSAQKLFDSVVNPDVVSWSSLIVGYALFGYGEAALNLFGMMRSSGFKPNEVTLLGVLTACSHVGLVEDGWRLYKTMEAEYGIVPTREHCSCMVDLLARAGLLYEAESLINEMACDPDIVVWKTLLAACKTRGNVDIGKRAAENILKIDPTNSSALVLLCNIHASSGNWADVSRLRSLMKEKGVKKVPGQSWIEVKDRIHVFFAEDSLHPQRENIYNMLDDLWLQMQDDGYVPSQ